MLGPYQVKDVCREEEGLSTKVWGQVSSCCACAHPDCSGLLHWYAMHPAHNAHVSRIAQSHAATPIKEPVWSFHAFVCSDTAEAAMLPLHESHAYRQQSLSSFMTHAAACWHNFLHPKHPGMRD